MLLHSSSSDVMKHLNNKQQYIRELKGNSNTSVSNRKKKIHITRSLFESKYTMCRVGEKTYGLNMNSASNKRSKKVPGLQTNKQGKLI